MVDKFNKQREDVAAGSRLQQSAASWATAGDNEGHRKGNEEEDLQVINTDQLTLTNKVNFALKVNLATKLSICEEILDYSIRS